MRRVQGAFCAAPMDTFLANIRDDWNISVPFIFLFVAVTTLDIIFGMAAAYAKLTLASKVSAIGMFKKLLKLLTVLVAALFDGMFPTFKTNMFGIDITVTMAAVVCIWWIACEGLSVTEKGAMLGLPMPGRLRAALIQVKDRLDGDDEKQTLPEAVPADKQV